MNVAADNTRKAMDNFNKRRARARAGRGRGGSSQRTVKGSTATATSGRGNVKDIFKEFHIPQVIIILCSWLQEVFEYFLQ